MALLKSFTDNCGNNYEAAMWRAVQINIGAVSQSIGLTFFAYKDQASFEGGKQPLPGGVKQYNITGAEFGGIAMAPPVGTSLYDVMAHAAESYALAKKDTDGGNKDADGKPNMVSFFENSTQV